MSLLALQDLFRRYREKATGVWTLGKDPGRTIFIDYGDTVFAQSTHLQDRLTYLLVERGKVTQAQMDYALANLKPGLSIGKNLIEMGFITQRDLLDVAKSQVERIVRGAFTCPDIEPVFEERELDANVVRLPMNTAQLFLAGTLSLQDREGLLELLGPLNQVVVLQGRSLMDLTLPPDLSKLPPLLDGTHTLLELSRESMAEPLRLGAFALFLREMGWARLHEMPPLDRHALDLALSPEPEPLSPLLTELDELFPETVPSLFSTIQEAERPTTNLEHLSLALDQDEPAPPAAHPADLASVGTEPVYLPEALGLPGPAGHPSEPAAPHLEGQGYPATPAMAILPLPGEEEDSVPLLVPQEYREPAPTPAEAPPAIALKLPAALEVPSETTTMDLPDEPPAPGHGRGRILLLLLLLLAGLGYAGYHWVYRTPGHGRLPTADQPAKSAPRVAPVAPPVQAPAPPVAVPSPGVAVPPPLPAPAKPAPPVSAPAPPKAAAPAKPLPVAKAPEPPVADTIAARLAAIDRGDLALAEKQGEKIVKDTPAGHFTLRLEIACQGDTIRRVAEIFKGQEPDIFLLPMAMRDGRTCYQVLYGRFPSEQAALTQVKRLPASFLADRNRPKPFKFTDLRKVQ